MLYKINAFKCFHLSPVQEKIVPLNCISRSSRVKLTFALDRDMKIFKILEFASFEA